MTEKELQEAKKKFKTSKDLAEKLEIGFAICETLFDMNNFIESRKYGFNVIKIAQELNNHKTHMNAQNLLGMIFGMENKHSKALTSFEKALEIAINLKDYDAIFVAYTNIGCGYHSCGKLHQALENFMKAMTFIESKSIQENISIEDIIIRKSTLYNNIALIYMPLNRVNDALTWFKKALKLKIKTNEAMICLNIAGCYYRLDNYEEANGYYQKSIKYSQESNNPYILNLCYVGLADIYIDQKQYEKALPDLYKAYKFFDNFKMHQWVLVTITKICISLVEQENHAKAKKFFKKGLEIVEYVEHEEYQSDFYYIYSKYCHETKKYKNVYPYLMKSLDLKDKVFNDNLVQNTTFLISEFDSIQKAKELEIYRLKNVELVKANKIIEEKNIELLKINETKDNILGMISHDMKNYIGSALSAHELLTQKDPIYRENKYAKMINTANNKALTLVKDILYLNKMEINEETLELTESNINDTLGYLLEHLRLMANKKNITIIDDFYPKPLTCLINKDKFHRVIDNLVINAIKFTPKEGTIVVKTKKNENMANIHIIDSGIGMDANTISKLFKQYSKAGRKGTDGEESTGLGLYIVKTILDKHNATIEVFSEVGKGSEFVIKIPIVMDNG